jgi:broad specificity phosphatase PhoE
MARWYLVRHGETQWNADERIQGQTDVPLHDGGRREAGLTGKRLSDTRFAAVYSSDLDRTQETASIILSAQSAQPAPEITTTPLLREVSYGIFEGLTWSEIREQDPRMNDRQLSRQMDFAPEQGESFRQVLARTGEFAATLLERHANGDLLIVAHGGSLRALTIKILGLHEDDFWKLRGLNPASISIVFQDGRDPALTSWNDVGHLI